MITATPNGRRIVGEAFFADRDFPEDQAAPAP